MIRTFKLGRCLINNGMARCGGAKHALAYVRCYADDRDDETTRSPALQEPATKVITIMPAARRDRDMDILMQSIRKCYTVDELLQTAANNMPNMSNNHMSVTFHALKELARHGESKTKILASPEFNELCTRALKHIETFDHHQILELIGCLAEVGANPRVTLMTAALQAARNQINSYPVKHVIYLDWLVGIISKRLDTPHGRERGVQIPLVEALKVALPLVLEVKIGNRDINFEDMAELSQCMRMAAFRNISADKINILMTAIQPRMNELTPIQHFWLVAALTRQSLVRSAAFDTNLAEVLLDHSLNELSKPEAMSPGFVTAPMLFELCKKSFSDSYSGVKYYHKNFLTAIGRISADAMPNTKLNNISKTLLTLSKTDHMSFTVLDEAAKQICERREEYLADHMISIPTLLSAFAHPSGYTPPMGWKHFLDYLLHQDKIDHLLNGSIDFRQRILLVLYNLAYIGQYPQKLFVNFLHTHLEDVHEHFTRNGRTKNIAGMLLTINIGLQLDSHNWPQNVVDDCIRCLKPYMNNAMTSLNNVRCEETNRHELLKKYLERAIGGPDFVKSNVWTSEGHYIDYVVVMRQGEHPIAIGQNESMNTMEEINAPKNSKIVAVLPQPSSNYLREPKVLKGKVEFACRTLRAKNILPLKVNMQEWTNMPDIEKTPFLMREMKELLRDDRDTAVPATNSE